MNTPDFDAAAGFVAANARVLDRRCFQRLFEDGPAAPVRDAVAAYRNDDGGWTFNWPAWSLAAERDWRGFLTVDALRVLRANGRPV